MNLTSVMLTGVVSLMFVDTLLADELESSPVETFPAAEDISVLEGKRLFFDQSERSSYTANHATPSDTSLGARKTNAVLADPPAGNGVDATSGSLAVSAGAVTAPTVEPELPSALARGIHYQARIHSNNAIRIIINGLPCESIDLEVLQSVSSEDALACIALDADLYQLSLLADAESVQVRRGERVLGTLIPGERL